MSVAIRGVTETIFFDRVGKSLRQRLSVEVANESAAATPATVTVRCGSERVVMKLEIAPGAGAYHCHAPVRWPKPAAQATLELAAGDHLARTTLTIGTHRPWTVYLLSDLCADDTWAYEDLVAHDRDDCRTTAAELDAGPENAYNFAAAYQLERFFAQATPSEAARLKRALASGRFYATPAPDQVLCGAFTLAAYPLLLGPYRKLALPQHPERSGGDICAYHMEAPNWTNGFVNLCAAAGFRVFAKSLLRYQAPWLDTLNAIPRLTRLEVSPGRFVYLLLRVGDYTEGAPLLKGLEEAKRFLHDEVIPAHEWLGERYPVASIPLIGMYGDLSPDSPNKAALKTAVVAQYNREGWEFPRVVNASWSMYGKALLSELGPAERPKRRGLVTVAGDAGSSWEAWMMSVQAETARMRALQRDVVSVRALTALLPAVPREIAACVERAAAEMVYLGDHAWNGSSDGSRALNLAVRRWRLDEGEKAVGRVRQWCAPSGPRVAVVNTLAWERGCAVRLPDTLAAAAAALRDIRTGETFPVRRGEGHATAWVPDVPGFGWRVFEACAETPAGTPGAADSAQLWPCPEDLQVRLFADGGEAQVAPAAWENGAGQWTAGPFTVRAALSDQPGGGRRVTVDVSGAPPSGGYELRLAIRLPWPRCVWRAESGGGFVTPGPGGKGGDSLLGIIGSVCNVGDGLSAASVEGRECVDIALCQSGLCGLGQRTTACAVGKFGEKVTLPEGIRPVMDSVETEGLLEWYLLGTAQNIREAFTDQGGARQWRFGAVFRRRPGTFDDAGLYRFAAGVNTPAEAVNPELLAGSTPSLALSGSSDVLLLGAGRQGRALEIDLYNTGSRAAAVRLSGRLVTGATVRQTDMLGRTARNRTGINVPGRSFAKVVVEPGKKAKR